MCTRLEEKAVNTVVTCFAFIICMYAAACNDHDICICTDKEIVIHQIVDVAMGDTGRDIYGLALGTRIDADIQTGLTVLLGCDLDVLRRLPSSALTILTDVKGALKGALEICDQAQKLFGYVIHTEARSFPSGQRGVDSSASSMGRMSEAGPA